jgi:hypothetical protein
MTREEEKEVGFVAPAKLRDEHIVLNPEAPERWRRYAVEDDHPLARAYEKGQLDHGRRDHTARDRFEAGQIFRGLYNEMYGGSYAASKLERVNGARREMRLTERLVDVRRSVGQIKAWVGDTDYHILRRVCGEGCKPSEAVAELFEGFEKQVTPIFCQSLDKLVDTVVRLGLHRLSKADG